MRNARRQRGVTLVETLVALAIMGLTTSAILVLISQNTRFAAQANERAYASIAADNLMVEALALSGPIDTVEEEGSIIVADREYVFRKTIFETSVRNLIRIEIEILTADGQALSRAQTLRKIE
ncbi:MAG: type II secretion system minor pseudopilin GspI [Pseudomonadota bacterium]